MKSPGCSNLVRSVLKNCRMPDALATRLLDDHRSHVGSVALRPRSESRLSVPLGRSGDTQACRIIRNVRGQCGTAPSSTPVLSCKANLSMMSALASLYPMTSTSRASRRRRATILSSTPTAEMSQKCARDTSMETASALSSAWKARVNRSRQRISHPAPGRWRCGHRERLRARPRTCAGPCPQRRCPTGARPRAYPVRDHAWSRPPRLSSA